MRALTLSVVLVLLMVSTTLAQPTTLTIATLSGGTPTLLIAESDLECAMGDFYNNGTVFSSVSIKKIGTTWFLVGEGYLGANSVSAGFTLVESGPNLTIVPASEAHKCEGHGCSSCVLQLHVLGFYYCDCKIVATPGGYCNHSVVTSAGSGLIASITHC